MLCKPRVQERLVSNSIERWNNNIRGSNFVRLYLDLGYLVLPWSPFSLDCNLNGKNQTSQLPGSTNHDLNHKLKSQDKDRNQHWTNLVVNYWHRRMGRQRNGRHFLNVIANLLSNFHLSIARHTPEQRIHEVLGHISFDLLSLQKKTQCARKIERCRHAQL